MLKSSNNIKLILICFLLYLPNLGNMPFWEWDEPVYAQAAKEMLVSGDYTISKVNNQLFLEKPPLVYWLETISFRIFEINEFSVRLVSALASVATAFIVKNIAEIIFSNSLGLLAGIICATSLMNTTFGRTGFLDSTFSLTLTLALYAFIKSYINNNYFWSIICGISLGLSILVRGPIGAIFFTLTVLSFCLANKAYIKINIKLVLTTFASCIIIALPWFIIVDIRTNGYFIKNFIFNENLNRIVSARGDKYSNYFYYVKCIIIGLAPWSFFIIPTIKNNFKNLISKNKNYLQQLLTFNFLIPFTIFSVSATKWPHYILPVFPSLSILIAKELQDAINRNKLRYHFLGFAFLCIFVNTSHFSIGWFFVEPNLKYHLWAETTGLICFLLLAAMAIILICKKSNSLIILCFIFSFLHSQFISKPVLKHDPLRKLCNYINRNVKLEDKFAIYNYRNFGIPYYLNKTYLEIKQQEEFIKLIANNEKYKIMLKLNDWKFLKSKIESHKFKPISIYKNPIENIPLVIIEMNDK